MKNCFLDQRVKGKVFDLHCANTGMFVYWSTTRRVVPVLRDLSTPECNPHNKIGFCQWGQKISNAKKNGTIWVACHIGYYSSVFRKYLLST